MSLSSLFARAKLDPHAAVGALFAPNAAAAAAAMAPAGETNFAQSRDTSVASDVWVEKYRPRAIEHMVLTPRTRQLLDSILRTGQLPHLLLHGPPGVGKTTAVMNLVREFRLGGRDATGQPVVADVGPNQVMHLNASDDRGLKVVYHQITSFVTSGGMFSRGVKFVVLDEVDHMSKRAQHALVSLIQRCSREAAAQSLPVRFCLMCNYLSKLDSRLRAEMVNVHFIFLPQMEIVKHLRDVCQCESLPLTDATLIGIQQMFRSDIRCMLNYMQSNQFDLRANRLPVPGGEAIEAVVQQCMSVVDASSVEAAVHAWEHMERVYQLNRPLSIKLVFRHLLMHHTSALDHRFMTTFRSIIHAPATLPSSLALHGAVNAIQHIAPTAVVV